MPRVHGGHIRPHERETDDLVPILGANIEVQELHSVGVRNTEQRGINLKTNRNYRNRIKDLYTFFSTAYPEYYSVGIRELSGEQCNNRNSFFWKNKHDLLYTGINVSLVKAFLAHKKIKDDGNTSSHVQLHKYNDAIMYGVKQALQLLPRGYYDKIDKFLNSLLKQKKKEHLTNKKRTPFPGRSSIYF
jgi:hypothetical protein